MKAMHQEIHRDLNIVRDRIRVRRVARDNVQLPKADTRLCGETQRHAVLFRDFETLEIAAAKEKLRLQMREAHELHVRMADRPA